MPKSMGPSRKLSIISVVMAVFNGQNYLTESIESILNQTYPFFEFIIIDDGSTDTSLEIIEQYAQKEERIKVVVNDKNLGLAKSLNKGIALAEGEYIARMDADDISLRDRFQIQLQFLKDNPQIDLVGSWVEFIDKNSQPTGNILRYIKTPMGLRWTTFFTPPFIHPTVMFCGRVFDQGYQYNVDEIYAQDFEFWTRLNVSHKFSNISKILLQYRIHNRSISISKNVSQNEAAYKISQNGIKQFLGDSISLNVVRILKAPHYSDSITTVKTSLQLLANLYHSFINKFDLSTEEFVDINLDRANRMREISFRNIQFISVWPNAIHSIFLIIYYHFYDLLKNGPSVGHRKLLTIGDSIHRFFTKLLNLTLLLMLV